MKKAVVVGGGFAGAYVARHLEKDFAVTLIDSKDYFEFTPGILRTIVDTKHMKKIQVLHSHYLHHAKLVRGEVHDFTERDVSVGSRKISYDYLFICSGSRYMSPIKERNIVLPNRGDILRKAHQQLEKAESVLIVGGGIVGVELAGEIIDSYPQKKMTIIHSKDVLMERSSIRAQKYAQKFLKKRGVEIIFLEKMVKQEGNIFSTNTGRNIEADIAFLCTGILPNTDFFHRNFLSLLDEKKCVRVEETLQLKGYRNIFVVGDLNDCGEEKTAQSAEKQAAVAVQNLYALEQGKELVSYHLFPKVMVISLGRYYGILTYKNFTLIGILPAFLKWIVEWKTMMKYR